MRTSARWIVAVGATIVIAAGCGSPSVVVAPTSAANQPAGPASAAPVETAPATGAAGNLDLRIANFVAGGGVVGPALDIYDNSLKNADGSINGAAAPLLAGLKFGQISDYLHPPFPANGGLLDLFALPAGSDPATYGGQAPSVWGGTNDTAQATIILSWDSSSAPTATALLGCCSLSTSHILEKGGGQTFEGESGPPAPAPSAGQAYLLASTNWLPQDIHSGIYLMIDDSCAPPLNGDPNEPGVPLIFAADGVAPQSAFALFAASPGPHHVSVVSPDPNLPAPTCRDLTARQGDQTVTLSAGEEAYAWVYGATTSDLRLAIAPIAP